MAGWFEKGWFQKLLGVSFRDAAVTPAPAPAAAPEQSRIAHMHLGMLKEIIQPVLNIKGIHYRIENGSVPKDDADSRSAYAADKKKCIDGWYALGDCLNSEIDSQLPADELRPLRDAIHSIAHCIKYNTSSMDFVNVPQQDFDTLVRDYALFQHAARRIEQRNPAVGQAPSALKRGASLELPSADHIGWSIFMAAEGAILERIIRTPRMLGGIADNDMPYPVQK
jgi:hypothetical protein